MWLWELRGIANSGSDDNLRISFPDYCPLTRPCVPRPLPQADPRPGNYVAIDCEMVGMGHLGSESVLARVSLVNYHGHVLLDTFVAPRERVTDYRTWVSGIRESDLRDAPTFDVVQKQVAALVEGRVLVGHAIDNDTKVSFSRPTELSCSCIF